MAYDALIDSGDKWETLIIYSALHIGDSDTVAAIACGWFGALYGFYNVPITNYDTIEHKNNLINIGEQLYIKYYS